MIVLKTVFFYLGFFLTKLYSFILASLHVRAQHRLQQVAPTFCKTAPHYCHQRIFLGLPSGLQRFHFRASDSVAEGDFIASARGMSSVLQFRSIYWCGVPAFSRFQHWGFSSFDEFVLRFVDLVDLWFVLFVLLIWKLWDRDFVRISLIVGLLNQCFCCAFLWSLRDLNEIGDTLTEMNSWLDCEVYVWMIL